MAGACARAAQAAPCVRHRATEPACRAAAPGGGRRVVRLAAAAALFTLSVAAGSALGLLRLSHTTTLPREPSARVARRTVTSARQGGTLAADAPSEGIYGVQQEPGEVDTLTGRGTAVQTAEAIETGVRGQGGGPRKIDSNAIILPPQSAREGKMYVLDYSQGGPGRTPICRTTDREMCEVAPDLFSRAGLVMRTSTDDLPGVNRQATSLETQHSCICLDSACKQIAEVRLLDVFDTEEDLQAKNASSHQCVLRRSKTSGLFSGCAQSILYAEPRNRNELTADIVEHPDRPILFPRTVRPWKFFLGREDLSWQAIGYRGYFNTIFTSEYEALPMFDSTDAGLEVDYKLLRNALPQDAFEWVRYENADAGAGCAATANWALHAASYKATTLDDLARGVDDEAYVDPLPPRASGTEIALSIGQGLLGVATMYLLVGEVYLELSKLQDERVKENIGCASWVRAICKLPVWLAWIGGLVLLGLEMIAIGVVWVGERKAMNTLGSFVYADFVASIARDTPSLPFEIDERGNVIIITVIVGTARYTSSNENLLRLACPLLLLSGLLAIVLALIPIRLWNWFRSRELAKDEKRSRRGCGCFSSNREPAGVPSGKAIEDESDTATVPESTSFRSHPADLSSVSVNPSSS